MEHAHQKRCLHNIALWSTHNKTRFYNTKLFASNSTVEHTQHKHVFTTQSCFESTCINHSRLASIYIYIYIHQLASVTSNSSTLCMHIHQLASITLASAPTAIRCACVYIVLVYACKLHLSIRIHQLASICGTLASAQTAVRVHAYT